MPRRTGAPLELPAHPVRMRQDRASLHPKPWVCLCVPEIPGGDSGVGPAIIARCPAESRPFPLQPPAQSYTLKQGNGKLWEGQDEENLNYEKIVVFCR